MIGLFGQREYAIFGDKCLTVSYAPIDIEGHPRGAFGLSSHPDKRADGIPILIYLAIRKDSYTVFGETESTDPDKCIELLKGLLRSTPQETLDRVYQEDIAQFQKLDAEAQEHLEALQASRDSKKLAKQSARKSFSVSNRGLVFDKTDGHCFYCQTKLAFMGDWHVEHKKPIAKGGSNDMDNLVAACKECNKKKHVKTAEEFVEQHA